MSKSLIRLIDEAILPAFLIVGIKALSIAIINSIFSLSFYYQTFTSLYYIKPDDVLAVNTYSDLAVYMALLSGIIVLFIRLIYFTDNKTPPSLLLKLAKANKVNLITTSINLYHVLFVWMVFFTGTSIYIIARCIQFSDNPFLGLFVVIAYLVTFWVLLKEIEQDIVKKLQYAKNALV